MENSEQIAASRTSDDTRNVSAMGTTWHHKTECLAVFVEIHTVRQQIGAGELLALQLYTHNHAPNIKRQTMSSTLVMRRDTMLLGCCLPRQ